MPEGNFNPEVPRPAPASEAPINPGQPGVETSEPLLHQTLPHVSGHGPTIEGALRHLDAGSVQSPSSELETGQQPEVPKPEVLIEEISSGDELESQRDRLRRLPFAERARELARLPVTEEERLRLLREVMPPIEGGTDMSQLQESRDGILPYGADFQSLTDTQKSNITEIDRQIAELAAQEVTRSRFRIPDTRDLTKDADLNAVLQSAQTFAGSDQEKQDALRAYVVNARDRATGWPSVNPNIQPGEWEPPVPLTPDEIINRTISTEPLAGSHFQQTQELLKRLSSIDPDSAPPGIDPQAWEQALQSRRSAERQRLDQIIDEAEQAGVFHYITDAMMSSYNLVQVQRFKAQTRADESMPEDLVLRIPGSFRETFWEWDDSIVQQLRAEFEGIGTYLASNVSRSLIRELHNPERRPDPGDRGDQLLEELKEKRNKLRQRATSKERLNWNEWMRTFDFNWAENMDELHDTVFDFLEKFEEVISSKPVTEASDMIRTWKGNGESMFDSRVNSLGLSEKDPEIKRLKATIEAYTDVIGGVKLLEAGRDGFEGYVGHLESFMRESIRHMDGIVLSSQEVFIADDMISADGGKIYLSGDDQTEKPSELQTEEFRETKIREAKKHASTHQLYITESDFEDARLRLIKMEISAEATRVGQRMGRTPEQIKVDIKRRLSLVKKEEQRTGVRINARYYWGEDDPIQELLLEDQRGHDEAVRLSGQDGAAMEARREARTGVFNAIKKKWDKKEKSVVYGGKTLFDLSPDERKEEIRFRIRREIDRRGDEGFGKKVDQMQDANARDAALWNWVKELNDKVFKYGTLEAGSRPWFPTKWDKVRLAIDRPEKLRDRGLTEEQATAMVEKINDPYEGMTDAQIRQKIKDDNALKGPGKVGDRELEEDIKDLLFERDRKVAKAGRAVDTLMKFHTFVGYEARAGGLTTRVMEDDPSSPNYGETKMGVIYDEVCEILRDKIKAEEQWIEDQVNFYKEGVLENTSGLTKEQIEEKLKAKKTGLEGKKRGGQGPDKDELVYDSHNVEVMLAAYKRGLNVYEKMGHQLSSEELERGVIQARRFFRRDAVFALTHAAKEIGLTEGDLPNCNYYYYNDEKLIQALAPYYGYTHEYKQTITQIVDRGRREIRAVKRYVAIKHMGEGEEKKRRLRVALDQPLIALHDDQPARPRVINIGGPLREIYESQMMVSTSGGVMVPDLIVGFSDLGIDDLFFESGALNLRQFWRGVKRLDEAELEEQSHWALGKDKKEHKDGVTYAKRLRGSGVARVTLVGGKVEGKGELPGVLNEPMTGAYKFRDMFFDPSTWIFPHGQTDDMTRLSTWRGSTDVIDQAKVDFQKILDEAGIKTIQPIVYDKLVEIGFGIMKPLVDYMDSLKYKENRGGKAPRNWKLDNELIFRDWVGLLLSREWVEGKGGREPGPREIMGAQGLDYAVQGRSPLAVKIFTQILRTSSYHLMKAKNITPLVKGGTDDDSKEVLEGAIKVKARMDDKKRIIEGRMKEDSEFKKLLDGRRKVLVGDNMEDKEIEKDLERMRLNYVEDRLHREFVGEWQAMFAEVMTAEENKQLGLIEIH